MRDRSLLVHKHEPHRYYCTGTNVHYYWYALCTYSQNRFSLHKCTNIPKNQLCTFSYVLHIVFNPTQISDMSWGTILINTCIKSNLIQIHLNSGGFWIISIIQLGGAEWLCEYNTVIYGKHVLFWYRRIRKPPRLFDTNSCRNARMQNILCVSPTARSAFTTLALGKKDHADGVPLVWVQSSKRFVTFVFLNVKKQVSCPHFSKPVPILSAWWVKSTYWSMLVDFKIY